MNEIVAKVMKRVKVNPETGCWIWQGSLDGNGYGRTSSKGKSRQVHRIMWEAVHGPILNGLFACHTCDVKRCCNPSHLFLGTQRDNMQDSVRKGRIATGERHGLSIHPERRARGDRSGSRLHPESILRGEQSSHRTSSNMEACSMTEKGENK